MARPSDTVPNFLLRTTRLGIWEIRWQAGGETHFKSTRTRDRALAETALKRHVAEWHSPSPPVDPLLSALIVAYRRDHLPKVVSQRTQREALDKIAEKLGAHRPRELTDKVLGSYATWRKAQPKWGREGEAGVSDGTVTREINALRGVLGWAARNRLISERVPLRSPVKMPEGRERYLTRDEVHAILAAAKATPHLDLFIRIAMATAARKSAILELKWNQIHWPAGDNPTRWRHGPGDEYEYVSLVDGMAIDLGRGVGNKRRAIVPIGDNAPLYRALRKAQKAAKTEYVIEYRGKPIEDVKTALAAACEAAKVTDCSPHVLKHTSISWMVAKGVPFGVITKITGTSTATLEKHYSHLSPDMARTVADLFAL